MMRMLDELPHTDGAARREVTGYLTISESFETLQVSLRDWLASFFFFFDFLDTFTVFYLYSMLVFLHNDMDNAEMQKQFLIIAFINKQDCHWPIFLASALSTAGLPSL